MGEFMHGLAPHLHPGQFGLVVGGLGSGKTTWFEKMLAEVPSPAQRVLCTELPASSVRTPGVFFARYVCGRADIEPLRHVEGGAVVVVDSIYAVDSARLRPIDGGAVFVDPVPHGLEPIVMEIQRLRDQLNGRKVRAWFGVLGQRDLAQALFARVRPDVMLYLGEGMSG